MHPLQGFCVFQRRGSPALQTSKPPGPRAWLAEDQCAEPWRQRQACGLWSVGPRCKGFCCWGPSLCPAPPLLGKSAASQMTPPRMAASRGGSCFLVIPQAMASLPDLSALRSRTQGSHGVNDSIIFQRSQSSPRIVCLEPAHNSPTKLLDFFLNFLTSCGRSFDWALLGLSDSEPSDAYSPYGLRAAPWGHWTDRGSLVCPG